MTTQDAKKTAPGFFAIYKPGQGKYVRWGTVGAVGILTAAGMWWANEAIMKFYFSNAGVGVVAAVLVAIGLLGGFLAFVLVNRPRTAEFMIMTESEMRKVTWPTRQHVLNSTKVVIFVTLILAAILWVIDYSFVHLFMSMKILSQ